MLVCARLYRMLGSVIYCRPDAAVYKFSEPDSTRNIRFEDSEGPSEVVKGATALKLVERLTFPGHADMTYVQQFLISFRSFCTPKELLGNLVDRYVVLTNRWGSVSWTVANGRCARRGVAGPAQNKHKHFAAALLAPPSPVAQVSCSGAEPAGQK